MSTLPTCTANALSLTVMALWHCGSPQNETATFTLQGALSTITSLNVWRSRIGGYAPAEVFQKLPPIAVSGGRFSLDLCAECVFTVTTLQTGEKGSFPHVPNVSGWIAATSAAGYSDDFDRYNISSEAAYWNDMAGSWEIIEAGVLDKIARGKVMRQMVPTAPIFGIRTEVRPLSMIGEKNWGDTNLTIDAMVERQGDGVYIGLNFQGLTSGPGYFVAVRGSRWSTALSISDVGSNTSSTQSGALPTGSDLSPGSWRRLSLSIVDGKASGSIDGHTLFADIAAKSATGFGVMGTIDYTVAQFDNLYLKASYTGPPPSPSPGPTPPGPAPGPKPPSPSPSNPTAPAKCRPPTAGQSVRLWTCDPSRDAQQGWNVTSGSPISLLHTPSLCLGGTTLMQLVPCATAPSFTAIPASKGSTDVLLKTKTKCLDVAPHPDKKLGGSCPIDIWACNNQFDDGANQRFALAGAHTSNPVGAIVSQLWGKDLCVSVCVAA